MILLYFSAFEVGENIQKRSGLAVVFLFSAVIAALALWSNYRTLYGEYKLAEFMEFLNPSNIESQRAMAGMPIDKFELEASEARPQLALIPELAGDWFLAREQLWLAEKRYQRAMDLEPRRPGIYRRMARLACLKGDYDAGLKYLNQAQKLFPRNPKYSSENPENRLMFTPGFKFIHKNSGY